MKTINTPWYVKAIPHYVDYMSLHKYLYDKYAKYYNRDNIRAQADFVTILDSLEEQEISRRKELKDYIEVFKRGVNEEYVVPTRKEPNFFHNHTELTSLEKFEKQAERLFSLIDSSFDPDNVGSFPEDKARSLFKKFFDHLTTLHNAVCPNSYKGAYLDDLLNIFRGYANVIRIRANKWVLNTILDEILNSGYGETFLLFDDLSIEKKEEFLPNKETVPPKEYLDEWIDQISKQISSSKKSKIQDPKTIELYLQAFVDEPRAYVNALRETIINSGDVPNCDHEILENMVTNSLRGWEKKFFKALEAKLYKEYAQSFKRYSPSH